MPIQMPQWTEFLSCPICFNMFDEVAHRPISLACGHTVCKACLSQLQQKRCPFDQAPVNRDIADLPVNFALLQLVGVAVPEVEEAASTDNLAESAFYNSGKKCIEELAMFLKPTSGEHQGAASVSTLPSLSRPMQRKLVTLINCQLVEEEGRTRAMRAARSLGERSVTELILQHQNPQQLSANLWAAVRARGCQFLGPGMQEEVLRLILLALEDGSALSRKVLVLFVVQRLEAQYPQASKTAIGHVVQLLYRASCFKVSKREDESSLMQLKEEFRGYEALRREHDAQIVQIATEAGLRISPEQWSSLLYGDTTHKSHMQSIIDKLQTPQSFSQSVDELVIALQRTGDPGNLSRLRPHLDLLSNIDPNPDAPSPTWENLEAVMKAIKTVVQGLVDFMQSSSQRRVEPPQLANTKYRTSMCRDLTQRGSCPRGANCTFAHSQEEMEKYRIRSRKFQKPVSIGATKPPTSSSLTPRQLAELSAVSKSADAKMVTAAMTTSTTQSQPSVVASLGGSNVMTTTVPRRITSVKVPVAKAMALSQTPKQRSKSMIYTSPTVPAKDQQPTVVPISQHMLSARLCIENPYYESNQVPLANIVSYQSPPSQQGPAMLHLQVTPYDSNSHGSEGVPMETNQSINSLSPNSYLREYYGSGEEGFKLPSGQQSTSEHLESLHNRKRQLLNQLRNTRNDSSHVGVGTLDGRDNSVLRYPVEDSRSMGCSTTSCLTGPCVSDHTYQIGGSSQSYASIEDDKLEATALQKSLASLIASTAAGVVTPTACLSATPPDPGLVLPWSSSDLLFTTRDGDMAGPQALVSLSDDEAAILRSVSNIVDTHIDSDEERSPSLLADEWNDEFIPFEHTTVSKYGPISRNMARNNQTKNTDPLAVTASLGKEGNPVTAVMFMQRPFPVAMEMPTKFAPGGQSGVSHEAPKYDQGQPPAGYKVASSLPTANIKPTLLVAGNGCDVQTFQSLKERMLNMPNMHKPAAQSTAEREQIRHELYQLNKQIDHLEESEHERLMRELQAIDLSIQETEQQIGTDANLFAQHQQEVGMKQAAEKFEQESQDKLVAVKLAMEEAQKLKEQQNIKARSSTDKFK